ncbi:uncharacterized protein BO95DRAFT_390954 [Aspergillus brunneoviolaceus CBS 621.78]|uniref:Uncharacterized protein n=1 Tax=Aspergillus brunneoviolaceus CBS 621.78 TaxID=1450534 RepID=A0ACD1G6Q6_9EURO|nr:hypothetical protein BO95DRAFT_390954 [Aspergillus brunneoviolaceus CBS 621.78]RAH44919.1 hypothetical protein BO95DRAFT_390954 [Aspergillus brunneoviolaceus CBS 621.78]
MKGLKDWLSRPLQLFLRSRPHEKRLSDLELLPLELLLHVTRFLAITDIICLGICSRTLHGFTTSLCDLNPVRCNKSIALSALNRLVRDLPRMFCCHYCARLHPITDVRPPAIDQLIVTKCPDLGALYLYRGDGPLPSLMWFFRVHGLPSGYRFQHCHLVAVLHNHSCGGRGGINAESLAYTEVVDYPEDPARTTLLSVEGRVYVPAGARSTPPSLVLQIQQWVLFHDDDVVFSDRDNDVPLSVFQRLFICRGQSLGTAAVMDAIRSVVQQRGFSSLDEQSSSAAECMRCPLCEVEFQISLEDCGKDGKAVIITKWLDLGAGLDLEDPKWKKKAAFERSGPWGGLDSAMASSGEVRRLFCESSVQESDPTRRNKSYLVGKRYRRAMCKSGWDFLYYTTPSIASRGPRT